MKSAVAVVILALIVTSPCLALNENTTIVLHAHDGFTPCEGPVQQGLDCEVVPPTVDVTGMSLPFIVIFARNYDELAAMAGTFVWPPSWTFVGSTWDCQVHQIVAVQPSGPGPIAGHFATAFDCVLGGALAPVGRIIFSLPGDGCLEIIQSSPPTAIADCGGWGTFIIPPENYGRVCAGPGGYDACDPASTPVESVTWGSIKSQYR